MTTQPQFITYEQAMDIFATKADLAELETRITREISNLESKLIRWMVGVMLGGMATAATLTLALTRLLAS